MTPGPVPKARRQRARDEARRAASSVALSGGQRKASPALPGAAKMPKEVRVWWRTLWASPIASMFEDVDVPALVRLARLWGWAMTDSASAAELAEARQLEDRFGLNPTARRRLGWHFTTADPASEDNGQLVADVRRLRAVDSNYTQPRKEA